uniref:RAB3A, member RAS oncogene family n=1 Tax=Anser brachyrhynchus TaxID=132585 RepID=A0A8B9I0D9_9AVES
MLHLYFALWAPPGAAAPRVSAGTGAAPGVVSVSSFTLQTLNLVCSPLSVTLFSLCFHGSSGCAGAWRLGAVVGQHPGASIPRDRRGWWPHCLPGPGEGPALVFEQKRAPPWKCRSITGKHNRLRWRPLPTPAMGRRSPRTRTSTTCSRSSSSATAAWGRPRSSSGTPTTPSRPPSSAPSASTSRSRPSTGTTSASSCRSGSTQIKTYSWDNAQVLLVGNKCDMEDERVVSAEKGRQLAEHLGECWGGGHPSPPAIHYNAGLGAITPLKLQTVARHQK